MTVITKTNETHERTQISDALTTIEGDVATNTADIATNAANIATNTADIATNTSDISTLQTDVAALENPPTSLVGRVTSNADLISGLNTLSGIPGTAVSTALSDWQTVLSVTSTAGYIEYLQCYQSANASDRNWQLRLTIDGTVVYTSDTDLFQTAAGDNNWGVVLVGMHDPGDDLFALGRLFFDSSILLEFKNTEGAGTIECTYNILYSVTG